MAKKMRFDYKKLEKSDFVHLNSESWGSVDCVIIKNSGEKVVFLMTEPYENSFESDYEYFSVEVPYQDLNGYCFKDQEDLFLLLGKTDPRIIDMKYKVLDNE